MYHNDISSLNGYCFIKPTNEFVNPTGIIFLVLSIVISLTLNRATINIRPGNGCTNIIC